MPDTVTIPKEVAKLLPPKQRIRLLYSFVKPDTYLTYSELSERLGIHVIQIQQNVKALKEEGLATVIDTPGKLYKPIKAVKVVPFSM